MIVPHSRPTIGEEDIKAVLEVLGSGNIAQGRKVREFENKITRLIGTKYAVACSSGTAAIHLALIGLEVETQDEVVMPSYVCSSPYFATLHAGAKPKIADIARTGFNVSAKSVKRRLSNMTKAIIVPHMFGNPAELGSLLELGIPLIEDCAQSLGAEYENRKVGSFGDLSVFSFYATKMITTGEGGMVLTNNNEFYARIIEARDYDKKPLIPAKYNYKMTDFQAALGLSQLRKLQQFINRRRQIASLYAEQFSQCGIALPSENAHKKPVFFRYVVLTEREGLIRKEAKKRGVICEKPVWKPLHRDLANLKCPNSDRAHAHALSIPIYPSLKEEEIEHVTKTLKIVSKKCLP